jgi:predicted DNA-binding WGR domain protein
VLKLYKREGDTLRYWEAWVDEDGLTVHWGTVGEIGEHQKTPLPPDEDPDMAIAQAAEPRVDEGYDEPEPDTLAPLVIQYPLQGKGSAHDFEKRKAVEELVTEHLGWTGNGEVEGGETKPGRMNIFCGVMDPEVAARTLVEALEAEELLEGAVIALVPEGAAPHVLWPQGGSGTFQV